MARTLADALNELYKNGVTGKIKTWINDYKTDLITALTPTFLKITDAANTYLSKNSASSTYLTKTDAANTYLGKNAKAASSSYADSAGTATNATNANYATSAGTATNATNANYATSAGTATNATNSNYATSAGAANKVMGGTVTLTGDVTGSATFNTAGNVSINCTVKKENVFDAINLTTDSKGGRDCNNVINGGFYRIYPNQNPWTNFPGTDQESAKYFLVMSRKDSNTVVQMAFHFQGNNVWYRAGRYLNSSNPTWSTWKQFAFVAE